MGQRRRRASKDDIIAHLEAGSRTPFRELAAEWHNSKPTPEALHEHANRSPDRWMQGYTQVLKAAGVVADRLEITAGDSLVSLAQRLAAMSDSEFEAAKLEFERSRALPTVRVVESTPSPSRSLEDAQRNVQMRRSQKGLGAQRPADLVRPAPVVPRRVRYDENLGNDHGAPPPLGA